MAGIASSASLALVPASGCRLGSTSSPVQGQPDLSAKLSPLAIEHPSSVVGDLGSIRSCQDVSKLHEIITLLLKTNLEQLTIKSGRLKKLDAAATKNIHTMSTGMKAELKTLDQVAAGNRAQTQRMNS